MAEEEVTGTEAGAAAEGQPQQQFSMQRVFLKDLSFESPASPDVFKQEWQPAVNVDLRTNSSAMEASNYEVLLTITITAKLGEETAFLVEVQQAGIFFIAGIEGEELRRVLSVFCPNMLFPYARETIDNIVTRGTFPALMLAQVNFEALYVSAMQQAQQQAQQQDEAPAADEAAS
ncbi:MAG: protein-export chaperone SecB [Halieaceae bacterium]